MNFFFILIFCSFFVNTSFSMEGKGAVIDTPVGEGTVPFGGKRHLSADSGASSDSVGEEGPTPAKKQNTVPFDVDAFLEDPHLINSSKKYPVTLSEDLIAALETKDSSIIANFLERFHKAENAKLSDKVIEYSFSLYEGDVIGQNILGKSGRR